MSFFAAFLLTVFRAGKRLTATVCLVGDSLALVGIPAGTVSFLRSIEENLCRVETAASSSIMLLATLYHTASVITVGT